MDVEKYSFPGFLYTAPEIIKYHFAAGVFTMLLKSNRIIHHEPEDIRAFEKWLKNHNIPSVRSGEQTQSGI